MAKAKGDITVVGKIGSCSVGKGSDYSGRTEGKLTFSFELGKPQTVEPWDSWLRRGYSPDHTDYKAAMARNGKATPAKAAKGAKAKNEPKPESVEVIEKRLRKAYDEEVARVSQHNAGVLQGASQLAMLQLMQGQQVTVILRPAQTQMVEFFSGMLLAAPVGAPDDD